MYVYSPSYCTGRPTDWPLLRGALYKLRNIIQYNKRYYDITTYVALVSNAQGMNQ